MRLVSAESRPTTSWSPASPAGLALLHVGGPEIRVAPIGLGPLAQPSVAALRT